MKAGNRNVDLQGLCSAEGEAIILKVIRGAAVDHSVKRARDWFNGIYSAALAERERRAIMSANAAAQLSGKLSFLARVTGDRATAVVWTHAAQIRIDVANRIRAKLDPAAVKVSFNNVHLFASGLLA